MIYDYHKVRISPLETFTGPYSSLRTVLGHSNSEDNSTVYYVYQCVVDEGKSYNRDSLIEGDSYHGENEVTHLEVDGSLQSEYRHGGYLFLTRIGACRYDGRDNVRCTRMQQISAAGVIVRAASVAYDEDIFIWPRRVLCHVYREHTLENVTYKKIGPAGAKALVRVHIKWGYFRSDTGAEHVGIDTDLYLPIYGPDSSWLACVADAPQEAIPSKEAFLEDFQRQWSGIPDNVKNASFYNACDGFGSLNMNNIQSLKEVCDVITSIIKRDFKKIPENLSELWLWYRYSYCTTRSDLRTLNGELPGVVNRLENMTTTLMKSYGVASCDTGVIRCKVHAYDKAKTWNEQVARALYSLGLAPTLTNLWDMIPFSFVVDWFLPIGEVLSSVEKSLEYSDSNYDFDRIVYSVSAQEISLANEQYSYRYYHRWVETSAPVWGGWYSDYDPTTKTQIKRVVDASSLIVSSRR